LVRAGSDGGLCGLRFDSGVLLGLLCVFEDLFCVLELLSGTFVASQMVFFSMLNGSRTVGVSWAIADFGGFLAGVFHFTYWIYGGREMFRVSLPGY
jgi:hypothetical protein